MGNRFAIHRQALLSITELLTAVPVNPVPTYCLRTPMPRRLVWSRPIAAAMECWQPKEYGNCPAGPMSSAYRKTPARQLRWTPSMISMAWKNRSKLRFFNSQRMAPVTL